MRTKVLNTSKAIREKKLTALENISNIYHTYVNDKAQLLRQRISHGLSEVKIPC